MTGRVVPGALDGLPGSAGRFLIEMRIVDGAAYVHYPEAMSQFMGGKAWVAVD